MYTFTTGSEWQCGKSVTLGLWASGNLLSRIKLDGTYWTIYYIYTLNKKKTVKSILLAIAQLVTGRIWACSSYIETCSLTLASYLLFWDAFSILLVNKHYPIAGLKAIQALVLVQWKVQFLRTLPISITIEVKIETEISRTLQHTATHQPCAD